MEIDQKKRLTDLLAILEKRDKNIPGLQERILRVKQDLANLGSMPPVLPIKKKKKTVTETVTKEIEVDE